MKFYQVIFLLLITTFPPSPEQSACLKIFGAAYAQAKQGDDEQYYKKGLKALAGKNFDEAEAHFLNSIREFADAPSFYQLGIIYLNKDTHRSRNKALKHFEQAVRRDSLNLEYRYAYASLLEDFARFSAINQYKKIIEQDNKQIEAWNSLARLKEEEFNEFHNSVRNMDGFMGSLEEFAMEDFAEAEHYLIKALEIDSLNFDTNFRLGKLYENADLYEKAIPHFEKCTGLKKKNKESHLYLGLLYYKVSRMKEAYQQYRKSFTLMEREERKEYTFESAKLLLEPVFGKTIEKYADWETEQFIESYWEVNDPLYLSDFNERLLEHYSRVAYAKLHFSVPGMDINGWKSDKGEFVLRYGEPKKRMRIRPEMGSENVAMKTEVWYYNGMTLAFTDFASSGNYQYSAPTPGKWKFKPQFGGDSQWFADNLKTVMHERYVPKYEGPVFDVPFDIVQFRNSNDRNKTDVYINYGLDLTDSTFLAADINYDHKLGLFFFDRYHDKMFQKKRDISSQDLNETIHVDGKSFLLNFTKITVPPDSGMMAFELQREGDKAVSSNRFKLVAKKYTKNGFNVSDIILATSITASSDEKYLIRRGGYSINPNPTHAFSNDLPLFIYYEIYNLRLGQNRLTDFEQEITIRRKDEEGNILDELLDVIGFDSEGKKVTMTSTYQTQGTSPQLFLQIDMANNEPGEYVIVLKIRDTITGEEASTNAVILWE